MLCDKLIAINDSFLINKIGTISTTSQSAPKYIYINPPSSIATVEEFKNWLNLNPVTLIYKIQTSITYWYDGSTWSTSRPARGSLPALRSAGDPTHVWAATEPSSVPAEVSAHVLLHDGRSVGTLMDDTTRALDAIEKKSHDIRVGTYSGVPIASILGGDESTLWSRLQAKVQAGDFSGLEIGDYIDVTVAAGANVPAQTVRYRIGAIDQYYRCGDTAKGHHIVMVPRAPVSVTGDKASNTSYLQWRAENDNNGTADEKHPYLCSKLHDWEINDFLPALPSALQSAIMTQRVLLEERYSSSGKLTEASSWSWVDLGKVWSPSEMEAYGCSVWGSKGYSVGFDSQFPIFTDTASRIASGRVSWWLRSVVGGSSSYACRVDYNGVANNDAPTNGWIRPLPCFLIG